MLPWKILPTLRARLDAYPAVVLVGPRQCGKTTLARSLDGRYFELEQEPDRLRLDLAWKAITELMATSKTVPRLSAISKIS